MNEALKGTEVGEHPLSSWLLFEEGLCYLQKKKNLSNLFLLFCSHPSPFVSAFAYDFKTENKKQSLLGEAT